MKPYYSRWLTLSLSVLLVLPNAAVAGTSTVPSSASKGYGSPSFNIPSAPKNTGGGYGSSRQDPPAKKDYSGSSTWGSGYQSQTSSGWGSSNSGSSDSARRAQELAAQRQAEADAQRRQAQAEAQRQQAEAQRAAAEQQRRQQAQAESQRQQAEAQRAAAEQQRRQQAQAESQRQQAEAQRAAAEQQRRDSQAGGQRSNPYGATVGGGYQQQQGNTGAGSNGSTTARPNAGMGGGFWDQMNKPKRPEQAAPQPPPQAPPTEPRMAPHEKMAAGVVAGAGVAAAVAAANSASGTESGKPSKPTQPGQPTQPTQGNTGAQANQGATNPTGKTADQGQKGSNLIYQNSIQLPATGKGNVIPPTEALGLKPSAGGKTADQGKPADKNKSGNGKIYEYNVKVPTEGSNVIPSTGLPTASSDRNAKKLPQAPVQQPKTPAQMAAEAASKWTVGTGAYSGSLPKATASVDAKGNINMTFAEQRLRGKGALKPGRNETINKDGSKTIRIVDSSGRLIQVENYTKDGRLRERTTIGSDGRRETEYPLSGKKATFTADGKAYVNSRDGKEQKVGQYDPNTNTWRFKRRYTDKRGRAHEFEFGTRETQIGGMPVDGWTHSDWDAFARDMARAYWFNRWLEATRDNHRYGEYYSGGRSYDGPDASGGAEIIPQTSEPAPAQVEVVWSKHFDILPEFMKKGEKQTYDDPIDIVADYVTLDLVQENSDEMPGWLARKWNWITSWFKSDGTENLRTYKIDQGTRRILGQQISEMAMLIRERKDINISGLFDAETGELTKNEKGEQKQALFIVDHNNAQQVADTDSNNCNLQTANVIMPLSTIDAGADKLVVARIIQGSSGENDCKAGTKVVVTLADLQEMTNELAARVEHAIRVVPTIVKK